MARYELKVNGEDVTLNRIEDTPEWPDGERRYFAAPWCAYCYADGRDSLVVDVHKDGTEHKCEVATGDHLQKWSNEPRRERLTKSQAEALVKPAETWPKWLRSALYVIRLNSSVHGDGTAYSPSFPRGSEADPVWWVADTPQIPESEALAIIEGFKPKPNPGRLVGCLTLIQKQIDNCLRDYRGTK